MAWTSLAAGLLLMALPQECEFPGTLDLTYHVSAKRRLAVPGTKDGVCHLVRHEASIRVEGARGVVTVRETGKKPPRGAQLASCEDAFALVAADEPRAWLGCPGGEQGSVHRARIRPAREGLPEGSLTVVTCGAKVAKVLVDLGLRWKPCGLDWQVDEPAPDFAACAERLPPATSRRTVSGSQALACVE